MIVTDVSVLERIYGSIEQLPIRTTSRSISLEELARSILSVGTADVMRMRGVGDAIKIRNDRMVWPYELQSLYLKGVGVGLSDSIWIPAIVSELERYNVNFIMSHRGGRLTAREMVIVRRETPGRHNDYGVVKVGVNGVEYFANQASRLKDMNRLFGTDVFPVRSQPSIVREGILSIRRSTNSSASYVARRAAVDHVFRQADLMNGDVAVRLIYSICVILAAHPRILQAGTTAEDVDSKVWIVPPRTKRDGSSHKVRVEKDKWSVAFTFWGLWHCGRIDRGVHDFDFFKKGFTGISLLVMNDLILEGQKVGTNMFLKLNLMRYKSRYGGRARARLDEIEWMDEETMTVRLNRIERYGRELNGLGILKEVFDDMTCQKLINGEFVG